jgi:RPA family protein
MSESNPESTFSSTDTENTDSNWQSRQIARRAFAAEINDATHVFKQSDEERAPNFALLPSGEVANRYFVVGTVTEVNDVGNEDEYLQGRLVDPTGTMFAYAGQYQPQAAAFLSSLEPPAYVAITAKPSTFEADGETYVSLRPETITHVDGGTRDRWVAETIERTEARLDAFSDGDSEFVAMSREQYGDGLDLDIYWEAADDGRADLGMGALHGLDGPESETEAKTQNEGEDAGVDRDEEAEEEAVDEAELAAAVVNAELEENPK